MEFDISTIFYIAFIVVSFLASGLSKNKKRAAEKQRRNPQPSPETLGPPSGNRPTFEELLEEFTGKRTTKSEPEVAPTPRVVAEPAPVVRKQYIRDEKRSVATAKKFQPFTEYEEKEVGQSEYEEMFSNLDDVKKAFVASEIFKRKY